MLAPSRSAGPSAAARGPPAWQRNRWLLNGALAACVSAALAVHLTRRRADRRARALRTARAGPPARGRAPAAHRVPARRARRLPGHARRESHRQRAIPARPDRVHGGGGVDAGRPHAARRGARGGRARSRAARALARPRAHHAVREPVLRAALARALPAAAAGPLGRDLRQGLRRAGRQLGLLRPRRAGRHRAHPPRPDPRDARDDARGRRRSGGRALLARARLRPLRRPALVDHALDAHAGAGRHRDRRRPRRAAAARQPRRAADRARGDPAPACCSRPAFRPPSAARSAASSATRTARCMRRAAAGKRVLYHVVAELSEPAGSRARARRGRERRSGDPRYLQLPPLDPRVARARARDPGRPDERRGARARGRELAARARALHRLAAATSATTARRSRRSCSSAPRATASTSPARWWCCCAAPACRRAS